MWNVNYDYWLSNNDRTFDYVNDTALQFRNGNFCTISFNYLGYVQNNFHQSKVTSVLSLSHYWPNGQNFEIFHYDSYIKSHVREYKL